MRGELEDHPPVDWLLAAFMGVKPKEKASTNYDELLALFPTGVIGVG